jgi:hypothetical protein
MLISDAGKAAFLRLQHPAKAETPIFTVPSSKLRSLSEVLPENASSPISRTLAGIRMLCRSPKQQNTFPRRTTKPALIVLPEIVREVMAHLSNAEWEIVVTESGRVRAFRHVQLPKGRSGIFVNCDGVSNVTDVNASHPSKTPYPRVETEDGTVKEVRRSQLRNARDSIL